MRRRIKENKLTQRELTLTKITKIVRLVFAYEHKQWQILLLISRSYLSLTFLMAVYQYTEVSVSILVKLLYRKLTNLKMDSISTGGCTDLLRVPHCRITRIYVDAKFYSHVLTLINKECQRCEGCEATFHEPRS